MSISCRRFSLKILRWSEEHPRPLPWKETTDPYKIWISEIILQQTQVAQGLSYYKAFIKRFPSIRHLAKASEDQVLRLWQGLGYNSRARNLHHTAQKIVSENKSVFPSTYNEIRALKGIGDYTAAAIASFAFGISKPVLDSNVIRVLSRVKGITGDSSKRETREEYYLLLNEMIKGNNPAEFNQAIMNFGAMQCTPRNPSCIECVMSRDCVAYAEGLVNELPIRKAKSKRKDRYFHYFIMHDSSGLLIHKRNERDIWQQMYQFPLIETKHAGMPSAIARERFLQKLNIKSVMKIKRLDDVSQVLTHQHIHCAFYEIRVPGISKQVHTLGYQYVQFQNLKTFAFPKVIRSFISDNSLLLMKLPQGIV